MNTAALHYCEMVTALGLLALGGSFILKAFTLFEHPTVCALYLMGAHFQEVHVYKPATSKPGNSETYIIGKGFKVLMLNDDHILLRTIAGPKALNCHMCHCSMCRVLVLSILGCSPDTSPCCGCRSPMVRRWLVSVAVCFQSPGKAYIIPLKVCSS